MKIVKFSDGRFGVRKWTLMGFEYLDMEDGRFWWGWGDNIEKYGKTKSELIARGWMEKKTSRFDWGKPV